MATLMQKSAPRPTQIYEVCVVCTGKHACNITTRHSRLLLLPGLRIVSSLTVHVECSAWHRWCQARHRYYWRNPITNICVWSHECSPRTGLTVQCFILNGKSSWKQHHWLVPGRLITGLLRFQIGEDFMFSGYAGTGIFQVGPRLCTFSLLFTLE